MERRTSSIGVSTPNTNETVAKAANIDKNAQQNAVSQDIGIVNNFDMDQRRFLHPSLRNMVGITIPQGAGVAGTVAFNNDFGTDTSNPDESFYTNLGKHGGTRARGDFERSSRPGGSLYPTTVGAMVDPLTDPKLFPLPFTDVPADTIVIIREDAKHRPEPLGFMDTPLSIKAGQPIVINRSPALGPSVSTNYTSGGQKTERRDYYSGVRHNAFMVAEQNSGIIGSNIVRRTNSATGRASPRSGLGSFPYFEDGLIDSTTTLADVMIQELGIGTYLNPPNSGHGNNADGSNNAVFIPNSGLGVETFAKITYSRQTLGLYVQSIGDSLGIIVLRPDICVLQNPETGFFNVEGVPTGVFVRGTSLIQPWEFNSPLPPGTRWVELGDLRDLKYPPYHPKNGYGPFIDEVLGLPLYNMFWNRGPHGELYENIKPLPTQDGSIRAGSWTRIEYGWRPNIYHWNENNWDVEGADKTGSQGATIADDDSYWTGTCLDPANWYDPAWEQFINYDKLALFLEQHPTCKLGNRH